MNKTNKRIATIAVVLSPFLYHFIIDIFKIGIKDGKATKTAMTKK